MKCRDFERVLCDYLDGTADFEQRRGIEEHRTACDSCSDKLADAEFALGWLQDAPTIDPPAELVNAILHDTLGAGAPAPAGGPAGAFGFLRPLLHPLMQPRLAMSVAMTLLWVSMMTFHGRGAWARLGTQESGTAVVAAGVADGLDRAWETGLELYETTVMIYRLQTEFGNGEIYIANPAAAPTRIPAAERDKDDGADASEREAR